MRYHVSVPVSLDRSLGGRHIVRDMEPGEFIAKTREEKAIAAFLVSKGYATEAARKPVKSEKEA